MNDKFSYATAKTLAVTDKYSGLELVDGHRKHISLPWSFLGRESRGIKEILCKSNNTFVEELHGAVVSFGKVVYRSSSSIIIEDQPCIHCTVFVDYVVFRPVRGKILKAEVSRVDQHSIYCLVHGVFTAALAKPHGKHLSVGETIYFRVTYVEVHDRLIGIRGSLVSVDSAQCEQSDSARFPLPDVLPEHVTKRHEHKHYKGDAVTNYQEESTSWQDDADMDMKPIIVNSIAKKKKKHKPHDDTATAIPSVDTISTTVDKAKRVKKRDSEVPLAPLPVVSDVRSGDQIPHLIVPKKELSWADQVNESALEITHEKRRKKRKHEENESFECKPKKLKFEAHV